MAVDAGRAEGLTSAEREELRRLRHEVKVLRAEREVLKGRLALRLSRLEIAAGLGQGARRRALGARIPAIHADSRGTYGARACTPTWPSAASTWAASG